MHKRTRYTIAGAAAIAVLAVGSSTIAHGEPPTRDKTPAAARAALPATDLFGALRGPATKLPDDVARGVPAGGEYGLDPTRAVAVPAPAGDKGATWYIVPGEKGVCLALPESGVCSTYDQLRENGSLWFATWGKNPKGVSTDDPESEQAWVVRGIAPDGVASLTVTGKGRGTTGFAKTNDGGAFYLDLPHGGDAVTLQDDHGKAIQRQQVGAEPAEG